MRTSFKHFYYITESAFANWDYNVPTDPENVMMDFYTLVNLDNSSLISSESGTSISDPEYMKKELERRNIDITKEQSGKNLKFVKNFTMDKMLNYLKPEMLNVIKFATAAEFRHIFEYNKPDKLKEWFFNNFGENGERFIRNYALKYKTYETSGSDWLRKDEKASTKRFGEEHRGYQNSYIAIRQSLKKIGLSWVDFQRMAFHSFIELKWAGNYGGEAWATIAKSYESLENAKDRSSIIIQIDHIYDLQHNTDTIFNKIKKYSKDQSYSWIKTALDFKANLETPKDFAKLVEKASLDLQTFTWAYTYNQYGVTREDITGEKPKVKKFNEKISNKDYETMSFDEIYKEYKDGDKDSEGNTFYIVNKPNTININYKAWYDQDNLPHKDDGPARVYSNNTKMWFKHGKIHREDGPAYIQANIKRYYLDGKNISEEEFTIKNKQKSKILTNKDYETMPFNEIYKEYKNGDKDSEGNTIFIGNDFKKCWTNFDNKFNKLIGPATVYPDGTKIWYKHGKIHREDGPAYITSTDTWFYLNDILLSEQQFNERMGKNKSNKKPSIDPNEKFKNLTNHDYEIIPFNKIYKEYKDGDKDEQGNIFHIGEVEKWWTNFDNNFNKLIGPALVHADGTKIWYRKGLLHREDGPAIIGSDGKKSYYLHGEQVPMESAT